ncbi:hypothetical protein, conserved [Leishmania tarentolae]|uniref:Flagellar Member 5 n=1 Tax=Leishmania tarentolae TaxID=5689 RepID=A0A640KUG6_LEITA|nr:hypothetical protein, conserved [Leishmania tarentolae]
MQNVPAAVASHVAAVKPTAVSDVAAYSVEDTSVRSEFEACCRALSHKVNKAVVEQLPALENGTSVDLSRNYIGAAGLQAISVILQHNPNITEVRAPHNGLTNDAVVLFCRAMRGHQQLSLLDFSDNPDVSLAGGLALVSLAQQTRSLRAVKLNGTHVLAPVLDKLTRALEYNASRQGTTLPPVVTAPSTVAVAASSSISSSSAREAMAEEVQTLQTLRARVEAALEDGYILPPVSPQTGWRVLDVPILAPPLLFDNEVRLLCNEVFPRLNQEFASHRIILCPVVVGRSAEPIKDDDKVSNGGSSLPPRCTAGSYNRALHFRPASDVISIVQRGRFLTIELVGDLPGDYTQLTASAMLRLHGMQQSAPQCVESHGDEESEDAAAPLQPVLYEAHEAALRYTQWLLVATRRNTRTLKVPAALAPLLTADPAIAHPDRHRSVVRAILIGDEDVSTSAARSEKSAECSKTGTAAALATIPTSLEWDYATEEYQWKRHVDWCEHVVATAPVAELVVQHYNAAFDCIDANGGVRLKHLDGFQKAVYARLRTVLEACVAAEARQCEAREAAEPDARTSALSRMLRRIGTQRAWDTTHLQGLATASSGAAKKNLINRMILYAANPPSRNMLLLHGTDAFPLASLMARSATRLQSLTHAYTLAVYTTRSALLQEEPTEIRSVITHVVSQLTKDPAVLRYVNAEVDMERLSTFFLQIISGSVANKSVSNVTHASTAMTATAIAMQEAGLPGYVAQYTLKSDEEAGVGNTASTHAFVVMLDGLEDFAMPVQPCGALVHPPGSSGNIGGGGVEPSSWSADRISQIPFSTAPSIETCKAQRKPRKTTVDWLLPRALARYVRLIASCTSNSAAFASFRHLGRDSVEMLNFGALSANEVEQYLSLASLGRVGLVFSEDEYECARSKRDAPIAEYMNYLLDAARSVHEAPGFLTQMQVIQTFPDTLQEAAQGVYDRLVHTFGRPVTRHVLGLLMASRWGLLLPELRDLLPSLSMCRLQELLRLLRPALEQESSAVVGEMMGVGSGNVLLGPVRLTAPSFLEVVQRECLQQVTDELQADNDQRVWHAQLAQYYLSIVYRWLQPGAAVDGIPAKVRRVNDAAAAEAYVRPETQALHRRAMKEVIYHMTQSGDFWARMDVTILSVPFMEQVYEAGLGYAYLRDLTAAFNERYQRHLLGEDIGEPSWQKHQLSIESSRAEIVGMMGDDAQASETSVSAESSRYSLPAVLSRMRDYICFAHQYGLLLSLHPHLVAQVALQIPASLLNAVQRDAVTYLFRHLHDNGGFTGSRASLSRVFFSMTAAAAKTTGKQPTHLRPITCATFLPNQRFVVTASSDRSLAWVNPESGAVAWYSRQPTAAVESLTVCRTSAYVAAVSEDRTVWVYDGLQGTLVSHYPGSKWFDAPIASLTFSARGRYLWVVTTDARVRGFACESGQLRCTMNLTKLLQTRVDEPSPHEKKTQPADAEDTAAQDAMNLASGEWRHRRHYLHVLVDTEDDEAFTTVVATELRQWRLRPWDEPLPTADEGSRPAHTNAALVPCELTMCCSLSKAPVTASAGPLGYKLMELWESASVRSPHMGILAAPHTNPEVQLFLLEHAESTARLVVRCPLVSSSSSNSGAAPAAHEVSVMRTSPDGRWLAIGLTGGAINLYCIGDAYHAWQKQQQRHMDIALVCRPTCIYTSLMATPGMSTAPPRSLSFHRDGHFLFALGHCLVCWRLPDSASAMLDTDRAEAVRSTVDGQYLCSRTPTCLAVLPALISCKGDVEMPRNSAEVAIGDDSGRLTLLSLWRPLM